MPARTHPLCRVVQAGRGHHECDSQKTRRGHPCVTSCSPAQCPLLLVWYPSARHSRARLTCAAERERHHLKLRPILHPPTHRLRSATLQHPLVMLVAEHTCSPDRRFSRDSDGASTHDEAMKSAKHTRALHSKVVVREGVTRKSKHAEGTARAFKSSHL